MAKTVPKKALSEPILILLDANKLDFFGCAFDQSLRLFAGGLTKGFGSKAWHCGQCHVIFIAEHASVQKQNKYPSHIKPLSCK